ncbi:MDR family MFS transporter [Flammeovirga kamogawensis]|uniref:MFS transporter n=1 Tax=Flammeovirga kamogawensis TaxID=373891 RepID=A0ABX8GPV2_9BACT|nr:MFS transporter [Flammeovirga kamogawensis]MBB6463436.1 putative MFS family arabinose efflux permease [Flammeovirga kamogawensis]QWG05638.1 MFS transporter [Flammeovirga kamogawensis]TRX67469.1 MFS transporter [Flammeovirga kamogawensis]
MINIKSSKNSFLGIYQGIQMEIWILALVSLINRIGAMVIPFLSIYLSDNRGFSFKEIGWIMSAFGVGSLFGSWLGGKLTDRYGFYPVIIFSLLTSGIGLIFLKEMNSFISIGLGFFFVSLLSDLIRPAIFVAVNRYSTEENRTKSITLVRLAINLGFAVGPATGGLLIAYLGYSSLFWVDGLSCIIAMIVFAFSLTIPKTIQKEKAMEDVKSSIEKSPYKDKPYLIFILALSLFGVIFIQYFSAVPLFYKDVHNLDEATIGLLLSSNGFVIVLLEMPLMHWVEKQKKLSKMHIMMSAIWCVIISYLLLIFSFNLLLLFVGMMFLTIGEMLMFPLSNTEAMNRSMGKNQGDYMALYAISFSFAHLVGHNLGMQSISQIGFNLTWLCMIIVLILSVFLLRLYYYAIKDEQL